MAADGTTGKGVEPTRPAPYRQQLADQGRGDMVSENRAANDRFERNSKALQRGEGQPSPARSDPGQAPPGQGEKRELSFGADRQPNQQNHAQLKQEQAPGATKGDGQQQAAKKELSFGADRQPNRQNHAQLKQEQSAKKELSFGPGRGQGQGQSQGQEQGLGR
jgi:hypothetical protein